MSLAGVREGDIVECDIRGRVFHAIVLRKERGKLGIRPITAGITYTTVTATQVVAHFRRSKASR
jgi:hypothetical protein